MKKKILILTLLLGFGTCFSTFSTVKYYCEEQKPIIFSPVRPSSDSKINNLLAEEQKPIIFSISINA